MLGDALIETLAQELEQAERTRTQVEHFSKRYAGMTMELSLIHI